MREIGRVSIQIYQLEDFFNIMFNNGYILEVRKTEDTKCLVIIFETIKEEREEN